jgi:hypothetical protein
MTYDWQLSFFFSFFFFDNCITFVKCTIKRISGVFSNNNIIILLDVVVNLSFFFSSIWPPTLLGMTKGPFLLTGLVTLLHNYVIILFFEFFLFFSVLTFSLWDMTTSFWLTEIKLAQNKPTNNTGKHLLLWRFFYFINIHYILFFCFSSPCCTSITWRKPLD